MSKTPINIESVILDVDSPDFKMKILEPMEFKHLMVLIGTNGSGKTLILKLLYAMNHITNLYLNRDKIPGNFEDSATFPIIKSVKNIDFNFSMELRYSNTTSTSVVFENGKVTFCTVSLHPTHEYVKMQFLSSKMRLFSAADSYLVLRGIHDPLYSKAISPDVFGKLLESYDLSDVEAMERFIHACPIDTSKIKYNLVNSLKSAPQTIDVDLPNKSFNITFQNGTKKNLSSLSNGEQAAIMMLTLSGI